MLFPTQLPNGPQMTDNRTTTATLGDPCPIVFGTASVAGEVIWLAPSVQTGVEQGGKGGPEQLTYQYNQSIAIGLCESSVDLQQAIAGVSRIWENGSLVYDVRPQQVANTDTGQIAETDEQYAQRLEGSATYAETFTLYLGSESQEPDPTMEAVEGIGNVQPYLGLAYVVYPNRLLNMAQGLRHPNFQFEVFQSGTSNCVETPELSNYVLYDWIDAGSGFGNPMNSNNNHVVHGLQLDDHAPGFAEFDAAGGSSGVAFDSLDDALGQMSTWQGFGSSEFLAFSMAIGGFNANVTAVPANTQLSDDPKIGQLFLFYGDRSVSLAVNGITGLETTGPVTLPGKVFFGSSQAGTLLTSAVPNTDPEITPATNFYSTKRADGGFWMSTREDVALGVVRQSAKPLPPCTGLPPAPNPDYCVLPNGTWQKAVDWALSPVVGGGYLVLQSDNTPTTGDVRYPLNPCMLATDPNNTEAVWTEAYEAAVAVGKMASGLIYGANYPVATDQVWQITKTICTGSGAQAKVSDIITALCKRAGVTDIDVTDMDSITVDGYAVAALSSASEAITPLRSVAFFDAVESGLTIRFQSRGKDLVATLTEDDLGAYDASTGGDTVPPSVSIIRALDSDLPRRIRFHYIATQRDYQAGEQDSPFKATTVAVNDQDVSIPVAMSDTQALRSAEILWADTWNGRNTYNISLGAEWAALECGDAIAIPVEGFTKRVRIAKDQNSGAVLRQLTCVSDNEKSYTSTAIAPPPGYTPTKITFINPSILELLDLPALQDADATAGFYTAVSRIWGSGNTYRGATVYRSQDSEATWVTQYSQTVEAIVGVLNGDPPDSDWHAWQPDTILVTLPDDSLSLESITDAQVLSGGNVAAIGADARWEIIQYATATKIGPMQWSLTRLLRGRRGTEWAIGKSRNGDQFVTLKAGALARIALNVADIGNLDDYEGVSIGASFSTGVPQPFTGRGVALKPFSPVQIKASYQTDGDILITWVRRDKIGRTLMSGVDIPNSEATLGFSIDVLDISPNSPETVIRTIVVSDAVSTLYTAAQIAYDFGSSPPSSLRVAVYQMSATVGRGTPGNAIIDLGS